jgi:general stress protein 26
MGTTKDLDYQHGIEKLKEFIEKGKICHFVTDLEKRPLTSRPMSTQEVDAWGNLWFFSADSSHKNRDIDRNNEVQLFYSNADTSEYLTVYGRAEIVKDSQKINDLWNPMLKTWFNEGKDDPEIMLIKVTPEDAYYWDTKNNKVVQLVKMLVGSVVGKQLDDGVEGDIKF